ncbi:hypothetical protein DCAR_0314383 [Daucus carota subsp. sativus]|uniref:Uncharacterized protein n=1 Tax=Daucus carota subsp. sativus TaxID=79200 RepID=A0AAF0WUG1_DAUCS|nr:hypothetical protein DCAR_0314383 [Daucus carota subsp. sativus]
MVKNNILTVSLLSNTNVVVGWYPLRRRVRRRRIGSIRLGNKRGFWFGARRVVQLRVVYSSQMFKKIIAAMSLNGRLVEACYDSLVFFRPQLFPLC